MIMIFYSILLYKTDLVLPYIDTASTQGCNVHMIYIINTAIHCTWRLSREYILCCYQNEKIFSFPLLCLYKMTDVHWTYCGNHFLMYLSQIIMLYIINLYSAVCQWYLNKTRRKKVKINVKKILISHLCIISPLVTPVLRRDFVSKMK